MDFRPQESIDQTQVILQSIILLTDELCQVFYNIVKDLYIYINKPVVLQ